MLARETPFKLGKLKVVSATRQVLSGDERQTLEPRVMQVLVVLARANGGIVTRDELIETCWAGRIVTDNAINRVISRARQLAEHWPASQATRASAPRTALCSASARKGLARSGASGAVRFTASVSL